MVTGGQGAECWCLWFLMPLAATVAACEPGHAQLRLGERTDWDWDWEGGGGARWKGEVGEIRKVVVELFGMPRWEGVFLSLLADKTHELRGYLRHTWSETCLLWVRFVGQLALLAGSEDMEVDCGFGVCDSFEGLMMLFSVYRCSYRRPHLS